MNEREALGWEHFEHEADLGVRGRGPTPETAFEQAALALTASVCEPERVASLEDIDIECSAPDSEILLADFLNAVIFEMATRHMLFGRFEVRIDDHHLRAKAWGERVDEARHAPGTEPKGATFTALSLARQRDGTWVAQCVVDV